MKSLYLIRHAKSSWKNPDLDDINRPLNNRGKHDAPFMGKRFKKYKVKPDVIISSPAKRALKTAKLISNEIDYHKTKIIKNNAIYGGSVQDLISIIHQIDDSIKTIFLIGHNPEITSLAGYLTDQYIENIPTCGIFAMNFNTNSWKDVKERKGNFIFFDYPKKHLIK